MLILIVGVEGSELFIRGRGVGGKGYEWDRQLSLAFGSLLFLVMFFFC